MAKVLEPLKLNRAKNGATELTPRTTSNGYKGNPNTTKGSPAITGSSCVTHNGKGQAGRLRSIPLPISGDTEGTDSYNTADAGNYACITEKAPAAGPVTITTETGQEIEIQPPKEIIVTQRDLQDMNLPAAQLHHDQAPNTLKNYNTNIYAEAEPQTFTEEITGEQVQIRATPITYTFDYGDGTTTGPTTNPGYSVGKDWDVKTPTSHQYKQPGTYHYTVTTEYRGEYKVENGPWQVIDGTATITSEPQTLQVWRVKSGRVDDNCRENPDSWGCSPNRN